MRAESIARLSEMFGDDFVDHFGGTREHEVRLWNQAVTNWEGSFIVNCSEFLISLSLSTVERYIELA